VVARVCESVPGVRPLRSRFEPVVGALLFAFEEVGLPVDAELLNHLAATLPPGSLFDS
ncbi:MAG: hypothetical protein GWN58_19475, partial [Anaerolineae bacterium]|nr:hypothetical protein [Anaerolineae bacterium]